MKQSVWMLRFFHMTILFADIHTDMVFFHFYLSRNKLITLCHYIWKLFPAVFAEFPDQVLLRHVVRDHMGSKPRQVIFLFTCGFFALGLWLLQIFGFRCVQITYCFRFIKEDDLSIGFHETDLSMVCQLF